MAAVAERKELALELAPAWTERWDAWQRLPEFKPRRWYVDKPRRPECVTDRKPIPRRDRSHITRAGYRKGEAPANKGRVYEPEHLTRDEVERLLDVCGKGKVGIRNRALIVLMWRTGLRVFEACALKPHHVDFDAKRVLVLRGKGNKRAACAIDAYGLDGLLSWLERRNELGVHADAPLFCTVCDPDPGGKLNTAYVRTTLKRYGQRAGITKRCHPHALRHTLACELVTEGYSLLEVQAQLRHSSPATTAGYLRSLGADAAFDKIAAREDPRGDKDADADLVRRVAVALHQAECGCPDWLDCRWGVPVAHWMDEARGTVTPGATS